jgi:hypothetical protein
MYLFGFMSRPRCNALELKERYGPIQYLPGDKTQRALRLIGLNGYKPLNAGAAFNYAVVKERSRAMLARANTCIRPFQKTNHPNNRGFPREKQPIWDSLNPGTT